MRKISRRSFLKAATVCALTALTACGGGDESAAVSVAKDENGAYVDTLTITLGRFAEPSAAALFPEGQTFEDNAYTRYIESKLNVDLVDSFEAGGDAFTNQLATCVASGELPDIMAVINGEMTPEETTIAENRGSSQAILDYLKDPQNVTEETLGGWHFYESRIIGLGASIDALEKNGNAEWITPKYPPTTPTSEQKKATLDKTELEAYVAIVTGAQPIDYFDTFVSEWKRLGGDAIAQEVQEYFAQ